MVSFYFRRPEWDQTKTSSFRRNPELRSVRGIRCHPGSLPRLASLEGNHPTTSGAADVGRAHGRGARERACLRAPRRSVLFFQRAVSDHRVFKSLNTSFCFPSAKQATDATRVVTATCHIPSTYTERRRSGRSGSEGQVKSFITTHE